MSKMSRKSFLGLSGNAHLGGTAAALALPDRIDPGGSEAVEFFQWARIQPGPVPASDTPDWLKRMASKGNPENRTADPTDKVPDRS